MNSFTYTLLQISDAAQWLVNRASPPACLALHAPMGAGKTTLSKAIVRSLGSSDLVSSPTFSIINEYHSETGLIIYHLDLYRLKDIDEALESGVEDILSHTYSFRIVEWPELMLDLLPPDTLHVHIEILDEQTRRIRLM
jgi:conserved hypothetical nucleotide-binding protein